MMDIGVCQKVLIRCIQINYIGVDLYRFTKFNFSCKTTVIPMSQHESNKYQKRNSCQFTVAVYKCNALYNWNTTGVFLLTCKHVF